MDHSKVIGAGVIIFLFGIIVLALPKILDFVLAQQERIERFGSVIRRFKYDRLVPWVDKIPVSADVMTGSRLIFILLSLGCFKFAYLHHWLAQCILPLFTIGWATDYLDGLKAEAETKQRGYATAHGKYFDPCVDMLCFTVLSIGLQAYYPSRIILWFGLALVTRTILFIVVLLGRLWSKRWRERLQSNILPKTITGEVKAALIAFSFVLILLRPENEIHQFWAQRVLVIAIIFEAASLGYLAKRALRDLTRPTLPLAKEKTGRP